MVPYKHCSLLNQMNIIIGEKITKVVSKFSWISERVLGIKYCSEYLDLLGAGQAQLLISTDFKGFLHLPHFKFGLLVICIL